MFTQHVLSYNTASTTALPVHFNLHLMRGKSLKFLAKIFTHEELTQNSNELLTTDLFALLLELENYCMH